MKKSIVNRKSYFVHYSIWVLSLIMASCQPRPIDIDIKPHEPKLVVSSQVIPGNIMIVSLTRSFSALSNSTEGDTAVNADFLQTVLVKNAFVTVEHLGKVDTLFMLAPGIYASISTLQDNYGYYTLYAKDYEMNLEVTASSTLLPKVKFDTVNPVVSKNLNDTSISVKYTITDNPSESSWYLVNYIKKNHEGGASLDINSYFSAGSNKVLTEFELLSDKTFENNRFIQETTLSNVRWDDTIAVTLSNISEGYYQFLTAYKRSGTIFNQLTGEPINYPTNVTGGFGYFNTHFPDIRYFYLKDW